jgi:hypothetical protein
MVNPIDETDTARNTAELWDLLNKSGTPYGDLTVVDRDNRIDVSAETPLSNQADNATAGVSHIPADSKYRIRANAGTESLETIDSLQYTPGYIAEIGIALRIPEAPTGSQEVRWGYWDGTDGAYFGWDSTGVFVEQLRGGTREAKVYQDNWNDTDRKIDPQQELQNGVITRLILALYNYGAVGFEFFTNEVGTDELTSDVLHNQNVDGQTTLASQNNPIRVEVDNPDSSDFDVFVTDRQATVRGQFTPNRRLNGERRTGVSLSGTTWVPIISFRRKDAFKTVNTEIFDVSAKPTDDIFLQIREDAGSTTDADYGTPQDVTASETTVEVDTTPTASISDGYFYYQTQFEGAQGNNSKLARLEGVDLQLKNSRPMTVFARLVSGTGGTLDSFNLNWAENW